MVTALVQILQAARLVVPLNSFVPAAASSYRVLVEKNTCIWGFPEMGVPQ